ncbi:MAG: InlB B-repeat-containing protein [Bacilli bacterium]|nr:InlB B-repeat-containing protein [Bacilli bacterium]
MVKVGRKFFFNQAHVKKNRLITIISIIVVAAIILITFFSTNYFYDKNNEKPNAKVQLKEFVEVEIFGSMPSILSYFKILENVRLNDIQINYDKDFTYDEDLSACTDEEKNTINKIRNQEIIVENNVDYFKCLNFIPNKTGYYDVNFDINGTKLKTQLRIIDTQAPVLTTKNINITNEESYYANDFANTCTDNSKQECYIEFYNPDRGQRIDYSKYKNPGTYEIKIVAKDSAGNKTEPQTATLTINEVKYYTVTFNSNGGSAVDSQRIREGERAFSAYPTRNGYYFDGWLLGKSKFNFENPINSDITLTASWKKIPTVGGGGGSSSSGGGGSYSSGGSSSSSDKCEYGTYDDTYEDISISATLINGRSMSDCADRNMGKNDETFQSLNYEMNRILDKEIGTDKSPGTLLKEIKDYHANVKYIYIERNIKGISNQKGGFIGIKASIIVYQTDEHNTFYKEIDTYDVYDCTLTSCKIY